MATKPTEAPARKARKTTTKPAATPTIETPADNDEPGVPFIDLTGVTGERGKPIVDPKGNLAAAMRANTSTPGVICYMAADCPGCGEVHADLPDVPGVSNIAEVFAASGYFPGKTIAQIATQIIAGRSLGMDPAQSMFDLEITPNEITYKIRRTFEKAADDKAAIDTAIINAFDANDRATPKSAASSNVFDMNANPIPIRADATDYAGDVNDPESIGFDPAGDDPANLANKGPSLDPEPETGQPEGPGFETQSAAAKIESAAAIELISEPDPGEVSPDMAAAAFSAIGVDVIPAVDMQRNAFGLLCRELGLDVAAKLAEYDNADAIGQQKKFTDCQKYYAGKVDVSRAYVLETLIADGKSTTEMQKGFFMYADVGLDPTIWTYTEAVKAQAAIADFFRKPAA